MSSCCRRGRMPPRFQLVPVSTAVAPPRLLLLCTDLHWRLSNPSWCIGLLPTRRQEGLCSFVASAGYRTCTMQRFELLRPRYVVCFTRSCSVSHDNANGSVAQSVGLRLLHELSSSLRSQKLT